MTIQLAEKKKSDKDLPSERIPHGITNLQSRIDSAIQRNEDHQKTITNQKKPKS